MPQQRDDGDDDDDDDDNDDDDECQFVECSNIHGNAMLVAHTGAVSLPDDKQRKTQTEKKTTRWIKVQSPV